jgi:NitT/TauT family transport system substrate-binding protein
MTTSAMAQSAMENISVGSGPVIVVANLEMAIRKGFFEEKGLKVTAVPVQSGAANMTGIIGGSLQFGATNIASLALARSRGIKVKIVAQGVEGTGDVKTAFDAILVKGDSPMKSAADLAGRTIAVNSVNSIATLTTNFAIEQAGGDFKSVKYVELPQGDALSALANGTVDAAWVVEPFISIAQQRGLRPLLSPYAAVDPHFLDAVYVASEDFIAKRPDVVRAFQQAITKANALAESNPEEVRKILPAYMKLDPSIVDKLRLPKFPAQVNEAVVNKIVGLAVKYGYMSSPVSIEDMVWRGK